MQMKEIANRLEDAEMQMWVLSSLLFVTNEAVKDKPGPEGDYAGVLCLASDMAKDLEDELRALRELAFDVLPQNKTLPEAVQPENPPGGGKVKPKAERKRKTLDWGKIQALHRAGWSHAKIADEMGSTVSTIATGLSRLRREVEESGKKQSGEADTGAENADD